MRALIWMLVNGGMIAALWFGLVEGVDGALNVGLVMVWVTVGTSFCLLSDEACDQLVKNHGGLSVPGWISWVSDAAVVIILAWHGWMWTAGVFVLAAMVQQGAINQAKERAAR